MVEVPLWFLEKVRDSTRFPNATLVKHGDNWYHGTELVNEGWADNFAHPSTQVRLLSKLNEGEVHLIVQVTDPDLYYAIKEELDAYTAT